MKIKNKVVLAGLLLSLSLASCNNMSENKNTADDSKNETEVTESADSKETKEKADKEAEDKDKNKDNKDADKADKDDSKEDKADDKESSDKEETADDEKAENKEAVDDKDTKENKEDSEGAQTKEEAIAELEQSIFDSRVTMRALEILQTEAPEAIEGREDEIQALIDHSNEVIESAREILDQVQNN